jgi:formylglycine-generating enzyme required for sulfatase activity
MISSSKSRWAIDPTSKKVLIPVGILFLTSLWGGYEATERSIYIKLEGKPDWGETSLFWDGVQKSTLDFSDIASGKHELVVQGGVFEGESCTRCCWERRFDVSISMGFEQEQRVISLETEEGFPQCPTLEAGYIFSSISAGFFDMGSEIEDTERSEDEIQHRVVLTQPFLMGQTEVTQRLYTLVTAQNPARFKDKRRPVESISWFEAINFCNRLSVLEGLAACYEIEGGYVGWKAGLACTGYRLPTEAEWEYSARAGVDSFYAGGDDPTRIWYGKTARGETEQVSKKPSNKWRLFDMSGNVSEWVWDYYGTYSVENFRDPKGPNEGVYRVMRGGDWMHIARLARVQSRQESAPVRRSPYIGFRIVQSDLPKSD